MAGTTLGELQELGAWKSELMVKRYAHFAPEQLRAAADKLATFSYTPPKSGTPEPAQAICPSREMGNSLFRTHG
jgi:hypothetical protein